MPCGCTAGILYERERGPEELGECCCGRKLWAGSGAEAPVRSAMDTGVGYVLNLGSVTLPWGEVVETALAVPKEGDAGHDEAPAAPTVLVKDLVCGMMIDPHTAAGTSTYRSQTYYFCALGCKERFDANPGQFASGGRGFLTRIFGR